MMINNRSDQQRAPLLEALTAHAAGQRARFHVPAHGGRFAELAALWRDGAALDLTELPGLDDLHDPSGPIAEAEALAAQALGAAAAHFLINGTSVGVQALLVATTRPGDRVLVGRDAHRSVIAGLIITGAKPVWLAPQVDASSGRTLGVAASTVVKAVVAAPDATVCQTTWPTFHGIKQDLAALGALSGAARPALLIDEAHGAHHYFGGHAATDTALGRGADGVALSIHKSGLSPTQTAIVATGPRIEPGRLRAALRLLQSTSPSYPLLVGLDIARRELALHGESLVATAHARRCWLATAITALPGLSVWEPAATGLTVADPLRLTVDVAGLGLSGWTAAGFLTGRGVDCEFADHRGVLLAIPLLPAATDDQRLLAALEALVAERLRPDASADLTALAPQALRPHRSVLSPRDAAFSPARATMLSEAAGRIAAETVCPYPPGIPLLVPGELIEPEDIAFLTALRAAGGHSHGLDAAGQIRVITD